MRSFSTARDHVKTYQQQSHKGLKCLGRLQRQSTPTSLATAKCLQRPYCGSPTSEAALSSDAGDLRQLLVWLTANGVAGVGNSNSKLGLFEDEDGERGVLICKNAVEGELLAGIPLRLALTDHPEDQESKRLVGELMASDIRLAAKLLQQTKLGSQSAWHDYIQALPRQVNSPYGKWPESATKNLQILSDSSELAYALDFCKIQFFGFSPEQWRWAISVVHSRSFVTAGKNGHLGVRMLVPLADMINHSGQTAHLLLGGPSRPTDNVRWEIQPPQGSRGWEFQIWAIRDLNEGEEAFFCYSNQSSWEYLLHAGFVPLRNSYESVSLFRDTESAVEWYMQRFPLMQQGIMSNAAAAALAAAVAIGDTLPGSLTDDKIANLSHKSLKLTCNGKLDGRLMAAFCTLLKFGAQPSVHQDCNAHAQIEAKAEKLVAFRIVEILFSKQVSCILTDLKLLSSLQSTGDADKLYFEALLHYYQQLLQNLENIIMEARMLFINLQPHKNVEAQEARDYSSGPNLMALRLRCSQKQVLWNALAALAAT